MEHRGSLLRLLLTLWLLSGWHVLWAGVGDGASQERLATDNALEAGSGEQKAASVPFRVTDYMMSGNYRYPDKEPFLLDKWWKGLSISTFWYPKMLNFQYDYQGIETSGFGLALTKDFSKSNAFRLGVGYNHDRFEVMADYQWNLSNYWLGYNPARRFEWLATVGLTGGVAEYEGGYRKFVGGQVGLQLRHTLSPWVSLYVEPQYKAMSPLYDSYWELGNIVDDGLAVQVGLITRLTGPLRKDVYGGPFARGAAAFGRGMASAGRWIGGIGEIVFMGHGLKVNRYNSLHRWYVELLGGTQLRDGEHDLSHLKLYEYDMEMTVGMKLNNLLAIQLGAYQERLDLTQHSKYPENVFGYRAELTFNALRFVWHKSEDKGWAWTVGGGVEAGRTDMWGHPKQPNDYRYIKPTYHTQLRRRLFGQTWLVLQGRYQTIDVDDDERQVMAFAGVHQDLASRKNSHRKVAARWNGLWVSGSYGLWSTRNNLWDVAVGYEFNDVHGIRFDYAYSHINSHNMVFLRRTYLNLFSLDYMMNVRNVFVGYDPNRRLNVYMLAGYNMAVHKALFDESLWHAHSYVGMEGGAQLELKINEHLAAFAEHKTVFLSMDPFVTSDFTQGLNMTGLVGLKVRF